MEYRSSVLMCNVEDHDCPVCRFLNGSRKLTDLIEVIEVLDIGLDRSERDAAKYLKAMMAMGRG